MTRKGPLITLLGGGALAAVLLAASINAATGGNDDGDLVAGEVPATDAPEETAEPTAPPEDEAEADPVEEPEPITYVGYVDGGGASVAIIVTEDEATAYVCDGNTIEAWLSGPAVNGELVLEADNGELIGSYDDARATGQTTVDDQVWTFKVEKVDAPEGLYQFASTVVGGAEVEGAWIILPDGTQIGVATVDGEPGPAPELQLDTGEVLLGGRIVSVDRLG